MNISKRAQKYLTKEYGGDFSILDVECISSGNGPIPEFIPKYHWQLTAVSDRFPNHTFKVYYRKDDQKKWYWSDNYHSVLFYNEVFTRTVDCAKQFFQVDSMVQILWSSSPWPEGINKNCSLTEWFQAGGTITKIYIYLKNYQPIDGAYRNFATEFISEIPNVDILEFTVLTDEGFEALSNNKANMKDFLEQHPEFQIDQMSYYQSDGKLYWGD